MTAGGARGPNFIAVDLIARRWAGTALTLSDTDDAMRLAEAHDLLSGQGWFDMHQARLAPPAGYDSHWSRLIDARRRRLRGALRRRSRRGGGGRALRFRARREHGGGLLRRRRTGFTGAAPSATPSRPTGRFVLPREWLTARLLAVVACGGIAALAFVLIEPRCLHGPYAMMDPALYAIWFSHINEMQSLATIARNSPDVVAALATFPVAAVLLTLMLACEPALRRDFAFLIVSAELFVACAVMAAAAKMSMYAIWLAMPLVAAFALRAFAWLRLKSLAARSVVKSCSLPSEPRYWRPRSCCSCYADPVSAPSRSH